MFQELFNKLEDLRIKDPEEPPPLSTPPQPMPSLSTALTPPTRIPDTWSGVIRDAIIEGDCHATSLACPVVINPVQGTRLWQLHDWKILQQARKTVMDYGLQSQAARQIVQWIFQADLTCPLDCQNLVRLLLTPSQLLLFEREWLWLAQMDASRLCQPGNLCMALLQKC